MRLLFGDDSVERSSQHRPLPAVALTAARAYQFFAVASALVH
jgi:hypothetical protein